MLISRQALASQYSLTDPIRIALSALQVSFEVRRVIRAVPLLLMPRILVHLRQWLEYPLLALTPTQESATRSKFVSVSDVILHLSEKQASLSMCPGRAVWQRHRGYQSIYFLKSQTPSAGLLWFSCRPALGDVDRDDTHGVIWGSGSTRGRCALAVLTLLVVRGRSCICVHFGSCHRVVCRDEFDGCVNGPAFRLSFGQSDT